MDGKGHGRRADDRARYDRQMGDDPIEHNELADEGRPGVYRPPPAAPIDDPEAAALVATATARRILFLDGPHGPSDGQLAVRALADRMDRDAFLGLLAHPSAVLRALVANHVAFHFPTELDRLYPLLEDDRPLEVVHGCLGSWRRVGSFATSLLGSEAGLLPLLDGEEDKERLAVGTAARSLLMRAARDPGLPLTVRGPVVEALAHAEAEGAEAVVRECLGSREPQLIYAALEGLAALPEAERWPTLRALHDHPSPSMRVRALEVASRLDAPHLGEALRHALREDPITWVRRVALLRLPRGSRESTDLLREALDDVDGEVREWAQRRLTDEGAGSGAVEP